MFDGWHDRSGLSISQSIDHPHSLTVGAGAAEAAEALGRLVEVTTAWPSDWSWERNASSSCFFLPSFSAFDGPVGRLEKEGEDGGSG